MKTLITLLLAFVLIVPAWAQTDTTKVEDDFEEMIEKIVDTHDTIVTASDAEKDTVHIRIGKHHVEVVSGDKNTHIDVETMDDFESKWDDYKWEWDPEVEDAKPKKKKKRKFDGHWEGLDFGVNLLMDQAPLGDKVAPYALYPEGTPNFMEVRPEKSFEVNWNIAEYSFGLGSYMGFVTGIGLNFNDYKFKNKYTIVKDENGMIQPSALPEEDFRKSKLSTVYLTAPLLFEVQIPGNHGSDRLFVTAGVVGGLKIGDHTKYKIGNEKSKDKGDFNLNPWRWSYMAKIGFDDFGIYATYCNTPLFESGSGPELYPLSIGVTMNF